MRQARCQMGAYGHSCLDDYYKAIFSGVVRLLVADELLPGKLPVPFQYVQGLPNLLCSLPQEVLVESHGASILETCSWPTRFWNQGARRCPPGNMPSTCQ